MQPPSKEMNPCKVVALYQRLSLLPSICDEKITCRKAAQLRDFLRIRSLKFYSKNRGTPKAFFECFWDLNGRFFIFKIIESRFGRKIPKSALFCCENLSQSFWRFLVCYAEPIESHYSRLVRYFCFPYTTVTLMILDTAAQMRCDSALQFFQVDLYIQFHFSTSDLSYRNMTNSILSRKLYSVNRKSGVTDVRFLCMGNKKNDFEMVSDCAGN